jgi:ATP-dependent Clp protease protease subunit
MLAIIDTMNLVKCDVQTVCVGKAMSAGAVILSSGKRGKRFITPNARTMIHQLFALSYGTAAEIEKEAQEIKRMQLQMERILAKNTKQPLKQIRQDLRDIKFMDAEGSVKYGLVDKIKKGGSS